MKSSNVLIGVTERSGIFMREGYSDSARIWNDLALADPVHAAIAARGADAEWAKSRAVISFLTTHLKAGNILDLGCGYGRIAKYLLPFRPFDGYIGVDSSIAMLSLFSERHDRCPKERLTPLFLVNADIDDLPVRDSSVDNVIVSAVFLHNPKHVVRASIGEIMRVLKPGGKLFIFGSFPNKMTLAGLQGTLYLLILRMLRKQDINGPIRYFSSREIAGYLGGFSSYSINPVGLSIIPKSILFFPRSLNMIYKKMVFRFAHFFSRFVPSSSPAFLCAFFDVIAEK